MLRLHCTQKVRRQFDIPHQTEDAVEPDSSGPALGDWYVGSDAESKRRRG